MEVSGPDWPHFTIVNLSGLIHSKTKQQPAANVELVQDVVRTYVKKPRSIILAVVSGKSDYANQMVLKLARAADKNGKPTLGFYKAWTLIAGSESEAMYVSLAKNQDIELCLGWHVLNNMDSETALSSLVEHNVKGELLFSQREWNELSLSFLGVDELRKRPNDVLRQIAAVCGVAKLDR